MLGLHQLLRGAVGRDVGGGRAAVLRGQAGRDALHLGGVLLHLPALVVGQLQRDLAEVVAPLAGLHRGHAVDQALFEVDARLAGELRLGIGVGKQQVLVPGDQGVDARHRSGSPRRFPWTDCRA